MRAGFCHASLSAVNHMTVWAFFFSFSFLSQEATPKQKREKHKHSNQHPESGMCATVD